MRAAAMLEPEHCMITGMFWSVAAFSASSASAGADLLSKETSSNLRPTAPPRPLMKSMMYLNCWRFWSPTWANGPERGSVYMILIVPCCADTVPLPVHRVRTTARSREMSRLIRSMSPPL
jgi:hypothetical protein